MITSPNIERARELLSQLIKEGKSLRALHRFSRIPLSTLSEFRKTTYKGSHRRVADLIIDRCTPLLKVRKVRPPQLKQLDPVIYKRVRTHVARYGSELCAYWWRCPPDDVRMHVAGRFKFSATGFLVAVRIVGFPEIEAEEIAEIAHRSANLHALKAHQLKATETSP